MNSRFVVPVVLVAALVGCSGKPLAIRSQFPDYELRNVESAVNPRYSPTPSTIIAKVPKGCAAGSTYSEEGNNQLRYYASGALLTPDDGGVRWGMEKMDERTTVAMKEIGSTRPLRQGEHAASVGDWKGIFTEGETHSTGGKSTDSRRHYDLVKNGMRFQVDAFWTTTNENARNRAIEAAECFARTVKVIPTATMFPGDPQDTSHTADSLDREFHKIGSTGPI